MKTKLTTLGIALGMALSVAMAQAQKNVILYIGDGFGLAPKTAARMALGQGTEGKRFNTDPNFHILALDNLKYNATVTTHSLNSWITDSAPGATVYAAGQKGKVDNEVIALNPIDGTPIGTILEAAKKQGYAVGLVTSTRVTHATPAAFGSHIWYRDLEEYIATQYVTSSEAEYESVFNSSPTAAFHYDANRDWVLPSPKVGVEIDVILGGGSKQFLPKNVTSANSIVKDKNGVAVVNPVTSTVVDLGKGSRTDDVDLIEFAKTQKNYTFVNSRDALLNLDLTQFTADNNKKLLGLFNPSHISYDQDRQLYYKWEPSLSELTKIAIEVLKKKSTKGFFLLVEGGRIDHLAHANSGGITVVAGTPNQYTISADLENYESSPGVPNGEAIYSATPTTGKTAGIYGSDYMIKEVVAFDYAVAEGRSLLADNASGKTLVFSTSDHECGGVAVVGLHDELDAQKNGTKIRTYSVATSKSNTAEKLYATPTGIVRGDGGTNGWYPDYTMVTSSIDGKKYPEKTSLTGKRIVIAYGSNPVTNGNGAVAGGTPGNHTPQDIWVGAEDNTGTHAMQIAGKGLLDNTAVTPIMADFLGLTDFVTGLNSAPKRIADEDASVFPNPFTNKLDVKFNLKDPALVSIEIIGNLGQHVSTVINETPFTVGEHIVPVNADKLTSGGSYYALIKVDGTVVSKQIIKY